MTLEGLCRLWLKKKFGFVPSTAHTLLQRYETHCADFHKQTSLIEPPMLEILMMAALLQLSSEPGLPWAAFFSRGRNACEEGKEERAQKRFIERISSLHRRSHQNPRITVLLWEAEIFGGHLVQSYYSSHLEPVVQDHIQVTSEYF